ncbi:MAG: hypothetical protein ACXW03_05755, partial [Methylobacter sp.]
NTQADFEQQSTESLTCLKQAAYINKEHNHFNLVSKKTDASYSTANRKRNALATGLQTPPRALT